VGLYRNGHIGDPNLLYPNGQHVYGTNGTPSVAYLDGFIIGKTQQSVLNERPWGTSPPDAGPADGGTGQDVDGGTGPQVGLAAMADTARSIEASSGRAMGSQKKERRSSGSPRFSGTRGPPGREQLVGRLVLAKGWA